MIRILIGVILTIVFYLLVKYVVKPVIRMRKYKNIQGATLERFIPVFGIFGNFQQNFKQHGQEFMWKKKFARTNPGTKIIVSNLLDRAYLQLMDPSILKQYFSKQHLYVKEPFLCSNRVRLGGIGLVHIQGQAWSRRRRIFSNIFNFDFFNNSLPLVQKIIQTKINKYRPQGVIDASQFATQITGSVVLQTFFGVECNDKIEDKEIPLYLNSLVNQGLKSEVSLRFLLFGARILKMGLFKEDRMVNQKFKIFYAWAQEQLKKKLKQESKQKNVFGLLKEKNLIETKQGLTINQIIDQFITFAEAGTQTTSYLTSMCFYYLAIYPEHQQTLIKEIRNASQPTSIKQYNQYPFLDALINQTFRFYGFASGTFIRESIEDHYLGDFPVPKGTLITPAWYQNYFNPQYFDDVEKFDPYRWMKSQKYQQTIKDHEYVFTPFSAGPRNCIGKTFALMEAKAIICSLVSRFNLKLKQGYVHKLRFKSLYGPVNPIYIILEPVN